MSESSTGTNTPSSIHKSSYLPYPVTHVASSLYRRLTDQGPQRSRSPSSKPLSRNDSSPSLDMPNGVYTPPNRNASPFQPPPLTPLTLSGASESTILSKAVAEEIRLLVPPRLQLSETWSLVYSLENDGVSLGTLYHKCLSPSFDRGAGFILVVQDAAGGNFGAYLTDPPRPSPSFYGTGECFLWRATTMPASALLANLPPPPSAEHTESMGRSTTIASPTSPPPQTATDFDRASLGQQQQHASPPPPPAPSLNPAPNGGVATTAMATPVADSLRFKAFPYSGINDYLIFCEASFLSVGGGDGRYGLWLDGVLERGVSGNCMTFGNEPLSEEGEKFEVVGVEVWCVGG
ncbi:MAG: oxidation resistance protein 1 [Ramalina farinacea]|uniref:Oxidation resistance protein 1 n=1 Tax=Ramalina farinacea TaxID=258253 RepID=A0AA43TSD0_9LECA|nr:oxidation resistance protein 1 [Ramalina farinacea]